MTVTKSHMMCWQLGCQKLGWASWMYWHLQSGLPLLLPLLPLLSAILIYWSNANVAVFVMVVCPVKNSHSCSVCVTQLGLTSCSGHSWHWWMEAAALVAGGRRWWKNEYNAAICSCGRFWSGSQFWESWALSDRQVQNMLASPHESSRSDLESHNEQVRTWFETPNNYVTKPDCVYNHTKQDQTWGQALILNTMSLKQLVQKGVKAITWSFKKLKKSLSTVLMCLKHSHSSTTVSPAGQWVKHWQFEILSQFKCNGQTAWHLNCLKTSSLISYLKC